MLVLASRSPQRRAILERLGVAHVLRPADVHELAQGPPAEVAVANARRKAQAAATGAPEEIVLGADTLVAAGGAIWGKPPDEAAARATLRALSGATHEVHGGIAVLRDGAITTAHELTRVTFRPLDDALLDWYVATGEWRGRAGAYAVQGAGGALVARLDGDPLNVVGLPVGALLGLLPDLLARGGNAAPGGPGEAR